MYENFFKDLMIKTIKTFFQSLAGTMTTAMIITEVDWKYALSASVLAAIYCIALNIGTNLPELTKKNDVEDGENKADDEQ